jgi:FtsH-binding integral membrane protein
MYEAYAASLVGVVCGAAAVIALQLTRNLSALPYAAVHLGAILLMIVLVTLGYDSIPFDERYPQAGFSRMLYILVSWIAFVTTMAIYRQLQGTRIPAPTGTPQP